MVRYFHQNWLLDCPYESVNLNDYVVALTGSDFIQDMRHEWNLFDYNQREFTRKVDVSLLDDTTDSPDDWQKFLLSTENLDKLVLRDDRKRSNNEPISKVLALAC